MRSKKISGIFIAFVITALTALTSFGTVFAEGDKISVADYVTTTNAQIEYDVDSGLFEMKLGDAETATKGKIAFNQYFSLDGISFTLDLSAIKEEITISIVSPSLYWDETEENVIKYTKDGNDIKRKVNDKAATTVSGSFTETITSATFSEVKPYGYFTFAGKDETLKMSIPTVGGNAVAIYDDGAVKGNAGAVKVVYPDAIESGNLVLSVKYSELKPVVVNGFISEIKYYIDGEEITDGEFRPTEVVNDIKYKVNCKGASDFEEEKEFDVISVESTLDKITEYKYSELAIKKYIAKIEKLIKPNGEYLHIGSSSTFKAPSAEYLLDTKYFEFDKLTAKTYYRAPGSSSFSSTTTTFSLSKVGQYDFYVLYTDPAGNVMSIDDEWELTYSNSATDGIYGYCENKGTETAPNYELKVPVFSFVMENTAGPVVTKGSSYQEDGYIGTRYTGVKSFTTEGVDLEVSYKLLFNNTGAGENADAEYVLSDEADLLKLKADKNWSDEEYEEKKEMLNWDSSALAFTPILEGVYRVECTAVDNEGDGTSVSVKTSSIKVAKTSKSVELESEWFKYNWTSVVFLSIAGLSLLGIIVILIIPQKEEKEEEKEE